MGLFGFGSKKPKSKESNQLFRDLTQETAILMMKMGIIKNPELLFLKDDSGILKGLYVQHSTNPQLDRIRQLSVDDYLAVCGMHALGAGIYVSLMQGALNKPVENFSKDDIGKIVRAFQTTDAYELALRALNIPIDSQNKRALDQIYLTALNTAKKEVGAENMTGNNLQTYMQVLFNAGVTLAYSV